MFRKNLIVLFSECKFDVTFDYYTFRGFTKSFYKDEVIYFSDLKEAFKLKVSELENVDLL